MRESNWFLYSLNHIMTNMMYGQAGASSSSFRYHDDYFLIEFDTRTSKLAITYEPGGSIYYWNYFYVSGLEPYQVSKLIIEIFEHQLKLLPYAYDVRFKEYISRMADNMRAA